MLDEFLKKTYSEVNDNIKFSEAKNAALITLNSALIATSMGKIFDSTIVIFWRYLLVGFILLLIIPLSLSLFSFRAITGSEKCITKKVYEVLDKHNHIKKLPEKYMYYSYIHKYYDKKPEQYLEDIAPKQEYNLFIKQLASQIVDLSGVAYRKFILFNLAIKIECSILSLAGILSLIIIIFVY